MLNSNWFLNELREQGIGCISGVPCSYVSSLYSVLELGDQPYLSATSEGEAVAIAAGAWLGGTQGLALCQNSGLGNMVNPLTSLALPFRIPVLLGVSRRGWPADKDEPQHTPMGAITPSLLELMGLTVERLEPVAGHSISILKNAMSLARERVSTAFVIEKGVFEDKLDSVNISLPTSAKVGVHANTVVRMYGGPPMTRREVLTAYLERSGTQLTIATTGYTGRELYALDDRCSHFYMVGSMGCAAGIGLGLSCSSGLPVTVLDGDGAILMKMGSMASISRHAQKPFLHVLLDNGQHESTGGQSTNGVGVDFALIAQACGYRQVWSVDNLSALRAVLRDAFSTVEGPVFLHCRVIAGTMAKLPRPNQALPELAARMRAHVATITSNCNRGAHGNSF